MNIAIFGAGGFGKEVVCLIDRINAKEKTWNLIGFFDDNDSLIGKNVFHSLPCLGGTKELNSYEESLAVVVAVGNPSTLKHIVSRIDNPRITYPNLIDTSIYIADPQTFKIGKGNIIQGPCIMTCDVSLGDFNVLNGSIILGHDINIGSYNTIMPAVKISGAVEIGELNFFGVGSIVIQQLKIGHDVKLAAGSVLMTNPKDNELYIGVPAQKMKF